MNFREHPALPPQPAEPPPVTDPGLGIHDGLGPSAPDGSTPVYWADARGTPRFRLFPTRAEAERFARGLQR